MESKTEERFYQAMDFLSKVSGNPSDTCPKCGKVCYCYDMDSDKIGYYSAVRKTVGLIPHVGRKVSRWVADNVVHPKCTFHCRNCGCDWEKQF